MSNFTSSGFPCPDGSEKYECRDIIWVYISDDLPWWPGEIVRDDDNIEIPIKIFYNCQKYIGNNKSKKRRYIQKESKIEYISRKKILKWNSTNKDNQVIFHEEVCQEYMKRHNISHQNKVNELIWKSLDDAIVYAEEQIKTLERAKQLQISLKKQKEELSKDMEVGMKRMRKYSGRIYDGRKLNSKTKKIEGHTFRAGDTIKYWTSRPNPIITVITRCYDLYGVKLLQNLGPIDLETNLIPPEWDQKVYKVDNDGISSADCYPLSQCKFEPSQIEGKLQKERRESREIYINDMRRSGWGSMVYDNDSNNNYNAQTKKRKRKQNPVGKLPKKKKRKIDSDTSPVPSPTASPGNPTPSPINPTTSLINTTTVTASPINTTTSPINTTTSPINTTTSPINTTTSPINTTTSPVDDGTFIINENDATYFDNMSFETRKQKYHQILTKPVPPKNPKYLFPNPVDTLKDFIIFNKLLYSSQERAKLKNDISELIHKSTRNMDDNLDGATNNTKLLQLISPSLSISSKVPSLSPMPELNNNNSGVQPYSSNNETLTIDSSDNPNEHADEKQEIELQNEITPIGNNIDVQNNIICYKMDAINNTINKLNKTENKDENQHNDKDDKMLLNNIIEKATKKEFNTKTVTHDINAQKEAMGLLNMGSKKKPRQSIWDSLQRAKLLKHNKKSDKLLSLIML